MLVAQDCLRMEVDDSDPSSLDAALLGRLEPGQRIEPVIELQLQPQCLRGPAEGAEAMDQIDVHVLVASEETFGEVLRYADGVGEVHSGGAHLGQDELAHQPAGVFDLDSAVRGGSAQFGEVPNLRESRSANSMHQGPPSRGLSICEVGSTRTLQRMSSSL